ncbi:hypothetical protein SS1G_00408 [Sclerotinia sclerotiorum 1980 UF-70]|uniref:Zn(2)-C6 fungal-type domain-containing protein n=2 Tax=Sclerotinia sclerotiorum (strain ATCC 18683 / 1980 / Ss-1) TaxID=665079 RepID=A7E536_SCLS1|nr:hypothetical protein SS1G_00408 [Sclerotinia sclerotiorum 1980 UF-70]APA07966.1 hypothetical protein sscle_03g027360 [Sclerotinia sclerotiorum 1980 UF-70]EDN91008.1 hypothetical protein SS1G_00408 [Sclerotinia sclerotiorum 1980 UF-70]
MAPCSRCERNGLECRTLPESKRCGECVRSGSFKCDVSGLSPSEWDILSREEARLEAEEEAAALAEQEAFSCRMLIRKKQKQLRDRGSEMLRRGVRSLDELDELLERERLENERVGREERQAGIGSLMPAVANSNVLDNFDPSSFLSPSDPFSFQNSSGPFWGDPDSVGEMPPTSQSS